jgi:glycolate oxidase subunit GlcD
MAYLVSKQAHVDPIIEKLRAVVGSAAVLSEPDELLVYECDGLPQHKYRPRAVVFPSSTEETSAVMRVLAREGVPFTPRGAGTGLSGGALALNEGVVIELARMRKILKIDPANRLVVVQPGVVNLHVSRAVAHLGLHYVPDPSSQPTCTIGGNIAENAGGIHCLKYGTTTDHVLGVRVVLAGGEVVDLGGAGTEAAGYDLLGVFIGSEGTFGIATEATLRLVPMPPAVRTMLAEFAEVNDASHAVSAIIAAGVMPAALEMMDREIIRAVEASVFAAGLPLDAGAALLIELDGIAEGIDDEAEHVKSICMQHGARDCRLARDENERKKLWAARKGAFGAIGRIAPDSMIQDAVVPRSRLPEVLDASYQIAAKYKLRLANVFHAGDGNLHPLICFDSRSPQEVLNVKEAGRELMETCVRAGGSITGEHGVGFDKRELLSLIFSEADMSAMLGVRAAFDPTGLCNPGKIIPMLRGCGEARAQIKSNVSSESKVQSPKSKVLLPPGVQTSCLPVLSEPPALAGGFFEPKPTHASSTNLSLSDFNPDKASEQLAEIVGAENISASPRLPASASPLTVSPGSIAEVCEVMKLASSEGWTIVPAGAMTWLDAGQPLQRVDLILSTRRLNRIIEHEPADLVAVAEAGVTLNNFNAALGQKGQWLPLDPPDNMNGDLATVGGVVATGLGGAQQFGYGAPRRHVIGMKVVLADGSLIKVGGRVVKNVAGYDLCKLFTGSHGTLGVIVEINFKLRPLPFATTSLIVRGERGALIRGAQQVIDSRLFPVAVELLSPHLAREAKLSEGSDHVLLLRFAGSLRAVMHQVESAGELFKKKDGGRPPFISDDGKLWRLVAALPSRFQDDLVWRAGLRPADLRLFLSKLDEEAAAPQVLGTSGALRASGTSQVLWQAGVGDGRVRVVQRLNHRQGESERTADSVISQLEFLKKLGALPIIEHGPAEIKVDLNSRATVNSAAGIMHRIKQQLDPNGIFTPRTFFLPRTGLPASNVQSTLSANPHLDHG